MLAKMIVVPKTRMEKPAGQVQSQQTGYSTRLRLPQILPAIGSFLYSQPVSRGPLQRPATPSRGSARFIQGSQRPNAVIIDLEAVLGGIKRLRRYGQHRQELGSIMLSSERDCGAFSLEPAAPQASHPAHPGLRWLYFRRA